MSKKNLEVYFLSFFILLIPIFYILAYLYVSLNRLFYPFELEWTEGLMFDYAYRLMRGLSIYIPPSLDFNPAMYQPLFPLISSFFIRIFGPHLFALRIISFFSSIIAGILIFLILKIKTRSNFWGIMGSGLFLGAFRITCFWYDLARLDSLLVMLLLLAFYLLIRFKGIFSTLLSLFILSLAFFTKQSTLPFILSTSFYLLFTDKKRGIIFLSIFPICAGIALLLNHFTGGWYFYFAFILPKCQPLLKEKVMIFLNGDLLKETPILCASAIGWFLFWISSRRRKNIWDNNLLLLFFFLSSFVVSLMGRSITGGSENTIIPYIAFSSIILCIAMAELGISSSSPVKAVVYGFIILQFIIFRYDPQSQIPTQKDRECGERFFNYLKNIKGEVLLPHHGFYLVRAGKNPCFYVGGLADVEFDKEKGERLLQQLILQLKEKLENRYYEAIILSEPGLASLDNFISNYYHLAGGFFMPEEKDCFFTITGWRKRPSYLYLPKGK